MTTTVSSYKLNPNAAREVRVSNRINEKGAYIGTLVRVEAVTSPQGTQGVELAFRTDDGRTADYLSLWTLNADGEPLYGRKVLDALMVVARLRGVTVQMAKVKKYDPKTKQEAMMEVPVLAELMGRRVGLFLVQEEYERTNSNETGWKSIIVGTFDPETQALPAEILDNTQPVGFDAFLQALTDRPLKKRGNSRPQQQHRGGGGGGDFADMRDDIPF